MKKKHELIQSTYEQKNKLNLFGYISTNLSRIAINKSIIISRPQLMAQCLQLLD